MPKFRIDPLEKARYFDQRHLPACSECGGKIRRLFNKFTRTCSPKCERARKTRRQKERRWGYRPL